MPAPIPVLPDTGKRTSDFDPHSGVGAQIAGSLIPVSEPDASRPTGFGSRMLTGQQLANWILTQVPAAATLVVSMSRADFVAAVQNQTLGQYQAKQLIITDREDSQGNPLPNVILMQVLGNSSVSEQDAYTLELQPDDSVVLTAVSYNPTADTTAPRSGGGGPLFDIYGASDAKRQQVKNLFTTPGQYYAADVALSGDTSTRNGSIFYDRPNGIRYELAPDVDTPDGNGNATNTWYRQAL